MALSANTPRDYELGERNEYGVSASTKIFEGAAVGINPATGYARPIAAGDIFVGFAKGPADNSAGAAGAITVRVIDEGKVVLVVSGAAITDLGKAVYASDDNTFTLTQGTNPYIGRISRWLATGSVLVTFESEFGGVLTELTDSTGGTPSDTLATGITDAVAKNAIASLAVKVNYLLRLAK
jgi:hypothetical protein